MPTKKPKLDLAPVFDAMRAILEPHADGFRVTDEKGHYGLDDNSVRGWSISFAAVVLKARAVSFYSTHGARRSLAHHRARVVYPFTSSTL